MKYKVRKNGDIRTRTVFLWLPKQMPSGDWLWLETVTLREEFRNTDYDYGWYIKGLP